MAEIVKENEKKKANPSRKPPPKLKIQRKYLKNAEGKHITEYSPWILNKRRRLTMKTKEDWTPRKLQTGEEYEEFMFYQWFTGKKMVKVKMWLEDKLEDVWKKAIEKYELEGLSTQSLNIFKHKLKAQFTEAINERGLPERRCNKMIGIETRKQIDTHNLL